MVKKRQRENIFFQAKDPATEEVLLTDFSLIRFVFYHCVNYNMYHTLIDFFNTFS